MQTNQDMNSGMQQALDHSRNQDALMKTADMMIKTAKMLQTGHIDPMSMMKTMDMMQAIMPSNSDQQAQSPQPNPADLGTGMGQ